MGEGGQEERTAEPQALGLEGRPWATDTQLLGTRCLYVPSPCSWEASFLFRDRALDASVMVCKVGMTVTL